MGQAAVDLPDPLNPPPATAASTDDLLAQMAGDEIDRMLAETEASQADPPPPAAVATPMPTAAPAPGASQPAAPEAPSAVPGNAQGAKPSSGSPAAPAPSESSDAQLDSLLEQLSAESSQAPASSLSRPIVADATSAASAEEQSDAMLAAERGALSEDPTAVDSDAGDSARAALLGESSPPFFLRILELLNAPLASAPDHVREAMGKVALVTMVNAASVLIYVVFFRHHHG